MTPGRPSQFVWYELHTPDAAASAAFFKAVLGWGTQDGGAPAGDYMLVTVDSIPVGGLLEKKFSGGAQPGWLGYIGVEDVDASTESVRQAGGIVHRPAADIPGVGRFSVVADPQEAIFVLFQPPAGQQRPAQPAAGAPGSPAWHDLVTSDWQSAFGFYAGLFGWTKNEAIDMGPSGVYQIFSAGSGPIGGMMNVVDPAQKPAWLYYFHVAKIEVTIGQVKEHGGSVAYGPAKVSGGQQIAHCFDPQGALFAIVSPG